MACFSLYQHDWFDSTLFNHNLLHLELLTVTKKKGLPFLFEFWAVGKHLWTFSLGTHMRAAHYYIKKTKGVKNPIQHHTLTPWFLRLQNHLEKHNSDPWPRIHSSGQQTSQLRNTSAPAISPVSVYRRQEIRHYYLDLEKLCWTHSDSCDSRVSMLLKWHRVQAFSCQTSNSLAGSITPSFKGCLTELRWEALHTDCLQQAIPNISRKTTVHQKIIYRLCILVAMEAMRGMMKTICLASISTVQHQVWFVRSSRTVYLFALLLGMRAMKCGARSAMHCPWSHLSFQNRVHALSPTSEMTTIEKKALTQWCTWIGNSSIPPMDYLAWFFFSARATSFVTGLKPPTGHRNTVSHKNTHKRKWFGGWNDLALSGFLFY
jgi:hypothetical protein